MGNGSGVDVAMNTHMKNVKLTPRGQPGVNLDHMSVRGSTIRYIILPDRYGTPLLPPLARSFGLSLARRYAESQPQFGCALD